MIVGQLFFTGIFIHQQDSLAGTFFQDHKVIIIEKLRDSGQNDWMAYLLLVQLAGLAIIFFKVPERISAFFSQLSIPNQLKTADRSAAGTGTVVYGYMLLNYMIVFSLYIFRVH